MGKISDTSKYPVVTPAGTDIVIGTDVNSSNATKNFTIDSIIGLSSTYTFSNVGNDSAMRLMLSDGTNNSDVNIVPGTGINLSSSSTTLANINLDIPVTIAHGGTGLTASGTKGHVMKSTGSALAMENRDGGFTAKTAANGLAFAWDYVAEGPNIYVTIPNNAVPSGAITISNVVDGDEGVIIVDAGTGLIGFSLPTGSLTPGGVAYLPKASQKDILRFKYYNSNFYWTIDENMS